MAKDGTYGTAQIIVLFVGILFVIANFYPSILDGLHITNPFGSSGGLSIKSLSYTSIVNEGARWLVTINGGNGNQNLVGEFSANTLNQKAAESGSGQNVQYGMRVEIPSIQQSCVYKINSINERFYQYHIIVVDSCSSWGIPCSDSEFKQKCIDQAGGGTVYKMYPSVSVLYPYSKTCIVKNEIGYFGNVEVGNTETSTEVAVTVNGAKQSVVINNLKGNFDYTVGDKVRVRFNGLLGSGINCPTSSNYKAYMDYGQNKWVTVDANAYTQYESIKSILESSPDAWSAATQETKINTAVTNLRTEKDLVYQGELSYTEGSSARIDLQSLISYPEFTLTVDAAWLGVQKISGKPYLVAVTAPDFKSGQTGSIQVTVKNTAATSGLFDITATCGNGFSSQKTSSTFKAGETKTLTMVLNAPNVPSGTTSISSSCSGAITDVESGEKATFTVSVKATKDFLCTPEGAQQCLGLQPKVCSNGNWMNQGNICPYECQMKDGAAFCYKPVEKTCLEKCGITEINCKINCLITDTQKTIESWFARGLIFIASILSGVVAGITTDQLLARSMRKKKDMLTRTLITIAVAILVMIIVNLVM